MFWWLRINYRVYDFKSRDHCQFSIELVTEERRFYGYSQAAESRSVRLLAGTVDDWKVLFC